VKSFWKKRAVPTPNDSRVRLRQAIVFKSQRRAWWYAYKHLVIHIETQRGNFLKHYSDRNFNRYYPDRSLWSERQVVSREDGDQQMAAFVNEPAQITKYFSDLDVSASAPDFEITATQAHGFSKLLRSLSFSKLAEMDSEIRLEDDDTLSLGLFIEDWLGPQKYFTGDRKSAHVLFEYFHTARFTLGFFGSFKFNLKKLTYLCELALDRKDFDLVAQLADVLGAGYGRVEAYLSKGHSPPRAYINDDDSPFDQLGKLPEFADGSYPSLRTAQYLSRKGLRLLKRIERELPDGPAALVFRLNLLTTADLFDQGFNRFSDYQLLVNYIIFADSGLQGRNPSGRKSDLAPIELRENFDSASAVLSNLAKSEREYYARWLSSIVGSNPTIAHHAFHLAKALGQNFVWSDQALFSMAPSSNPAIHSEITNLIFDQPERLLKLAPKDQGHYLRLFSGSKLKKVLTKHYSDWRGGHFFAEWVAFAASGPLGESDFYITQHLIREHPWAIDINRNFGLFLNLARHSKLDSIENWGKYVGLKAFSGYNPWRLNAESILRYLGAGEEQGFFDVSAPPLIEKLTELFASELVWFFQRRPETAAEILVDLVDSGSPNLLDLAVAVLNSPELPEGVFNETVSTLNSPDFSFVLFRSFIDQQNEAGLLNQLIGLAEDQQQVFWRRNGSEVEYLLREWPSFTGFLWRHLDVLPTFVTETFLSYQWLPEKFGSQIRSSQVAKMNETQTQVLAKLITAFPSFLSNDRLLAAILVAPNATLNELGVRYVTGLARLDEFWLLMLESNLPVSSKAAYDHLKSKLGQPDFIDKLLMALDSNNSAARSSALGLLKEIDNPELVADIIQNLAENRNPDTWSVIAEHISLIRDGARLQHFTKLVFLSRLQARRQKELIKQRIQELTEDVHEAVEKDVLIRLSLSSVIQDREWALKQIALGSVDTDAVVVERTWSGGPNV